MARSITFHPKFYKDFDYLPDEHFDHLIGSIMLYIWAGETKNKVPQIDALYIFITYQLEMNDKFMDYITIENHE